MYTSIEDTREVLMVINEEEIKVPIYPLTRGILANLGGVHFFANLLEDLLNFGWDFNHGLKIGQRYYHRTIEATLYRFALGIMVGLAGKEGRTDARNQTAIECAVKIKKMLDDGEISRPMMI